MRFINNTVFRTLLILSSVVFFIACEKDFNTIGTDIIGDTNFNTGKATFDVFAYNRKIKAVRTDNLSLYQLGEYKNPVYGKTKAKLVSQLSLTGSNPTFGTYSQAVEDNAANDNNNLTVPENETVTKVYLDIPFFSSVLGDSDGDGAPDDIDPNPKSRDDDADGDGVIAPLDSDDNNANTDYDGDGLSDIDEKTKGTSPYLPDTDFDGINDNVDNDNDTDNAPKRYKLDSIIGNREAAFSLKVNENTYYLTELNPNPDAPFSQSQQYYSSADYSGFTSTLLGEETNLEIDDMEILIFENEDDPETPDEDESLVPTERLTPRIRIELDPAFFQQKILDMEGSDELASNANFQNYLRGIILEIGVSTEDLLFLLNINSASIEIQYKYDKVNTQGTAENTGDDTIDEAKGKYKLGLAGKRVNLIEDEPYPQAIANQISDQNAESIYLKGTQGIYTEIKLFDEDGSNTELEEARNQNWLINEANLVFYLNNEQLSGYGGAELPERLYLYDLDNKRNLVDYNDFISEDKLVYGGVLEKDDNGKGVSYKFRVTDHINRVLRKDSTNVKMGLVITSNIKSISNTGAVTSTDLEVKVPQSHVINPFGTILYGSNVAPEKEDKKLKLEIFYTKLKTE